MSTHTHDNRSQDMTTNETDSNQQFDGVEDLSKPDRREKPPVCSKDAAPNWPDGVEDAA